MAVTEKLLDIVKDDHADCHSVMVTYSFKEYLDLVESAYENKGGLIKQRPVLKTYTAMRIRERMLDDLKAGAILPPVVLGLILSENKIKALSNISQKEFKKLISGSRRELMVIDGMQRTIAMYQVSLSSENEQGEKCTNNIQVRVEYWITKSINSLIYRMLVLNTGQVHWNLKRQIEGVFNPIATEIKNSNIELDLLEMDDSQQRAKGGQYRTNELIELFLVFGLRKEKLDLEKRLANEFSRLDFIEAVSNPGFIKGFEQILGCFVRLDRAFDKYRPETTEGRFRIGRDLFGSRPARMGFMAACAKEIMGRPGFEKKPDDKKQRLQDLSAKMNNFIENIKNKEEDKLGDFLDLMTLNEIITGKTTGKISDYERDFFLKAFETLIAEKFDIPSMTVCWRAF